MSELRGNECIKCRTPFPAGSAYKFCPECGYKQQSSSVEQTQAFEPSGQADAAFNGVHSSDHGVRYLTCKTEGQEKETSSRRSTSHIEFVPTESSVSSRIVATDVPQLPEETSASVEESGGSDQQKPYNSQNRTEQTGELQTSTPNAADLSLTPVVGAKFEEESQNSLGDQCRGADNSCATVVATNPNTETPRLTSDDQDTAGSEELIPPGDIVPEYIVPEFGNVMLENPRESKDVVGTVNQKTEQMALPSSLNITFHVMVQMSAWSWSNDSQMTIRFGNPELGGWVKNAGELAVKRRFDDGLAEFQCTLQLPVDLIVNKCVTYRYVIYSHQDGTSVDQSDAPYEYLSWDGVKVCRCMVIEDFNVKCEYHQFDGIASPEPKSSFGSKALKYLIHETPDKTLNYYQEKCMLHYLDHMRDTLISCELSENCSIHSMTEKILHVFDQLCLSKVSLLEQNPVKQDPRQTLDRIAKQLPEAFKNWLLSIVKMLHKRVIRTAKDNGLRMASVITVIQCFCEVTEMPNTQLTFESLNISNYSTILSMFQPIVDLISHKSYDLEIVFKLIHPHNVAVAKSVISFCKHLSRIKHLKSPEWLNAIPLIHFLLHRSTPFQKVEKRHDQINWDDPELQLKRLRKEKTAAKTNLGVVKKHFKEFKPLGVLDPLFLPLFVLLCPEKELPELFLEIPLYLSSSFTLWIVRQSTILESEVVYFTKLFKAMLTVVKRTSEDSDLECLESTLEASRIIYIHLLQKLPLTTKHSSSAIRETASFLFYTITMLKVRAPDQDICSLVEAQTGELIETVYGEITRWIKKKYGSTFGSPVGVAILLCAHEELEFCQSLYQLDCPQLILESWQTIILEMIKERVERVPLNKRIDLFCVLETLKVVDQSITTIFMDAAMESLHQMDLTDKGQSVERLYRGTVKQRETVGKIMESIVLLKYPLETESITFNDLLEWELWPSFIKIFSCEPKGGRTSSCLPEHCAVLSACAQSILLDTCVKLSSGEVVVMDLEKILQRRVQMERLCSVANIWKGLKKQHPKDHLAQRLNECQNFKARRELLAFLCSQVTVPVIGLNELKLELERDYSSCPINTLCTSTGRKGSIEYLCCESATPLEPIMVKFRIMAGENNNDVFRKIWLKALNSVRKSNTELTLEGILYHLWEPAYEECQMLLDSIHERTILLSVVDQYFLQYNDEKRIVAHLFSLYTGVEMCSNNRKPSSHPGWLKVGVHLMLQYWKLCQYAKAAKVVLDVSEKLKITGNFRLMKTLATTGTSDIKSKPLSSIDETLINAGSFLEDFRDAQKLECLQTFVDCVDIVEWIRTYTKEVNELHRFVSIALHTSAGEGDYESDKLATLRTVGTAFEPLIYGLKGDITYEIFCEKCRSVWDELRKNSKLTQMLRTCNDELEWYKSLKDTQDSVTSYGEMYNILKRGTYTVGSQSSTAVKKDFHDVIAVKLTRTDRRVTLKSQYSFYDLQDLESKLVLITGSKAKNRREVDLFLDIFHGVYRVADALISLQRKGNIKYLDWKMEVDCKQDKVEALAIQARLMEDELQTWKTEVKRARSTYYELNYFTTPQLIILRKDLGGLKTEYYAKDPSINPTVLALLHGVSADVTGATVLKAVRDAAIISQQIQQPSSESIQRQLHEHSQNNGDISDKHHAARRKTTTMSTSQKKENVSMHKECSLKADKLNQEQEEILIYIVDRFGFPQQLVLKAFDECKGDVDKYDIQNWCIENAEKYNFQDDDDDDDEAIDTVSDEPMSIQLNVPSSSFMSWVGQSFKQYIARKTHEVPKPEQSSPTILRRQTRIPGLTITCDSKVGEHYLSLEQLGIMLRNLPASVPYKRPFKTSILKIGTPNLIVTSPKSVLKAVLSLYMENESFPLPTLEEVLICNAHTTAEEVTLLWMRSVKDSPSYNRIFCLVHAERLSYLISDKVLHSLAELTQGQSGYRVVIICSSENEEKSHIIMKLHSCRRQFAEPTNDDHIKRYLKAHFTANLKPETMLKNAASVDCENSCVRVVTSHCPGMGKTFYIKQTTRKLKQRFRKASSQCTIAIHGPEATPDTVMDFLSKHLQDPSCSMYHIDIASDVLWKVDTILFSLLILGGLTDSQGRIWRSRSTHYFAIEATLPKNEVNEGNPLEAGISSLLNLLPSTHCPSPEEVLKLGSHEPMKIPMNMKEFKSERYQRVYQYLRLYSGSKKGNIDHFRYSHNVEGNDKDCLKILIRECGVNNPSWSEIEHFVEFLNIQLKSCEDSVYCDEALVGDILAGLKKFIVRFMIRMSKDFATPFLEGEVARGNQIVSELDQYQIDSGKLWERSIHPYIFFNQNSDGTITFVGFKVTRDGNLVHPINGNVLEIGIMSADLFTGLQQNGVNFSEDYTKWEKPVMVQKLASVMGVLPIDPDTSYVLTMDNVVKILAIHMRFRCNIPVVIMGETGCGKTRLIRYMSELARQGLDVKNMFIMKVHGGTTEADVQEFVSVVENEAVKNVQKGVDTIAFFDEANTTDAVGLIKEVMCDRRINGRPILENLKFIAACNPYRKHSDRMIEKLRNAGLGFYVRESDTTHKLGGIPLRHLVYRVLDLPPSMRPLVYDFGQLKTGTEFQYTSQVVSNHVYRHAILRSEGHSTVKAIANVLTWSQSYMRKREDECSFVSLRDVERAMLVFVYFYDNMRVLSRLIDEQKQKEGNGTRSPNFLTRSLLLSLSVCYHARLQHRSEYEIGVAKEFHSPLGLSGLADELRNEIRWCQEVLLNNMRLGENIAKNEALRENVFMMVVCVELRIPLFIVGKPGSSKSLAKSIVQESMKGKSSRNRLMKQFKEVDVFSYQCSQLSTSGSVIDVFNTAKKLQQKQDISRYVAVVVLDEVGLAEDSPNLPLKALHPLLEDGTDGGGQSGLRNFQDQIISRDERVGFIGISNWALDPAKMNRGVMVTRGDPTELELELSARGICSNKENDPIRERLEEYFQPLAKSYLEICRKQHRQFFGLRDFYSLIKMMYWMCDKSGNPPTWPQFEHAIRRNFGGLDGTELDPINEFKKNLPTTDEQVDLAELPPQLHQLMNPDCSKLGLIKASLSSTERTWHGENRYLLFLTENYVALDILKHYLNDIHTIHQSDTAEGLTELMEPFILFGSSFPKDKEYTQVCRNINQIKVCMETGRTVILLNLENLYESLYDVLNQYYIYNFGNRYVDLGLQTHRVRCRVHDNFKLILIAEKDTVYNQFPTPLINRLEKHFVLTSSILEVWQMDVLKTFQEWIKKFSTTRERKFSPGNAFIGFQTDTPAAIIFQTTNFLRKLRDESATDATGWETVQNAKAFEDLSLDRLAEVQEDSDQWKHAILNLSQYQLLQTASPDAIVRLQRTDLASESEELQLIYFGKQVHNSLEDFLTHHLTHAGDLQKGGLLLQVTTHSHLLSFEEIKQLSIVTKMTIVPFHLHEFETELDFCKKIGPYFKREAEADDMLLAIQCDSSYTSSDLIACARYRIYDERAHNERKGHIHVVFIVFVPHHNAANKQDLPLSGSTIGYLGDPWISGHVDDLRPSLDTTVIPKVALGLSISELFLGKVINSDRGQNEGALSTARHQIIPLHRRLQDCIQASASKLEDVTWSRATKRIEILVGLIPKSSTSSPDQYTFHGVLVQRIAAVMRERDEVRDPRKRWVLEEAMDLKKLHTGGTFGNVLVRKVDEVIVPIFAYIISAIDKNYNLDLLDSGKEFTSPVSQLWLAIFCDPKVFQFSYSEIATSKEKLPGAGSRKSGQDFKCRLPFSWLIKETADALWSNAKSSAGDDISKLHSHLAESLRQTSIGNIIDNSSVTNWEEFSQYYLYDFVRMVHKNKHKKKDIEQLEYELIANALNAVVRSHYDRSKSLSLLYYIAALHIFYNLNKAKVSWFSQLVSLNPGIMLSLKERSCQHQEVQESEIVLHLLAVERLLHELQPPLKSDKLAKSLVPWLHDVRMCQNIVDSILSVSCHSPWVKELNQNWQLIQAMRMFLEHIMMSHTKVSVKYARRLECSLKQCGPNFLEEDTLHKVKDILKQIDRELKSKSSQRHGELLTSCRDFFMEVVSSLCFGGKNVPDPDLIKSLMETVFAANQEGTMFNTRDITPYDHDSVCDEVPVVRSFLLQLLLEHNSTLVKEHLQVYFLRSCQAIRVQTIDLSLSLLCIQCFEDALSRSFSDTTSESSLEVLAETMNEGFLALLEESVSMNITVPVLEGLAKIRFGLSEVGNMLQRQMSTKQITCSQTKQLVRMAQNICSDMTVNVIDTTGQRDTTGPIVYLMRLLVRQYGMPCLEKIADTYSWVIPKQLRTTSESQEKILDQFVIYNDHGYSNMRECLDRAAYGREMESLIQTTNGINTKDSAILLLGIYRKVTLSRVRTSQTRQIVPEVLMKLDTHLSSLRSMSSEMKRVGRMLIANEQGRNFVCLNVMPKQSKHVRNLAALVVHTAIVFTTTSTQNILFPFLNMLQNPAVLRNAYLPTMPEDSLYEVRQVAGGQFYECPRGHPYFVGECGRPMQEYTCNFCGSRIGGRSHNLRSDNKAARRNDATKKGHDIGNLRERATIPSPERGLSPLAVCILRALMHSAFIWCCSNNVTALGDVAAIVSPSVNPNGLQEFFWKHLEKDLEGICAIMKKGEDESILLVHLVLKQILTQQRTNSRATENQSFLSTRPGRAQWEATFNETFIQPVTEELDQKIFAAFSSVMNDNEQEHDQLFYLVYERVQVTKGSVIPHMWTFRSKITLENLTQKIQEKSVKDQHPTLYEFVQAEINLRATQYLPDIVHLQQYLYDTFNFRLDKSIAVNTTIGEYVSQISNVIEKETFQQWMESLNKAWRLVVNKLRTHGRLRVKEEFLIPVFGSDTLLEYIIPTTVGAGACTTALVDFLTLTHNDFIERCHALASSEEQSTLQIVWSGHKVPITHISHCHLVVYEQQLQSIILSHCHYFLSAGNSHLVKYDFKALEKHILDRFIHGKPMILADIPQVVYRKDTHTAAMFSAIRKKVCPQECLPIRLQQEILAELHTLEKIREMLDIIDIVLGFLSSGGGNADRPLNEYVEKVLKMRTRTFSQKIKQYCKLGHIVSLWETLSVDLARQLYFRGEEPFDMVKKELLVDLSKQKKQELDTSLRSFDLNHLVAALFQFIQTHVSYCPTNEFEWMIVDVLPAVLGQWDVPEIVDFEVNFPDNIKISQAIAAWKCIALYQKMFQN